MKLKCMMGCCLCDNALETCDIIFDGFNCGLKSFGVSVQCLLDFLQCYGNFFR